MGPRRPRIYLAGPEVFLEDAPEVGAHKRAVCDAVGLEGIFPLDAAIDLSGLGPVEAGSAIGRANENLMRACDAVVANMTPFRGPGMDGGTAFEMGFMKALGRPVFAYTNAHGDYAARVAACYGGDLPRDAEGRMRDPNGWIVEDFAMTDNLMMAGAAIAFGAHIHTPGPDDVAGIADLTVFTRCVESVAAHFKVATA